MTVATAHYTPGKHETGSRGEAPSTVEQLIRAAHVALAEVGAPMSPAKVAKACREYHRTVAASGMSFGHYLANVRTLTGPQASAFDAVFRRLSYADPTGETATGNVDRERGARR